MSCERSEKVAAHHGNYWEVLLYGHLLKDRSTMYDLTSRLELRATSEDRRVLDALAHARRHKNLRDYIPKRNEKGHPVDISFATLNRQKAVRDKNRPGAFVRKHFEAMVALSRAGRVATPEPPGPPRSKSREPGYLRCCRGEPVRCGSRWRGRRTRSPRWRPVCLRRPRAPTRW
ncbi:hypothetical protein [Streptomyces mutabilis]|uniref:hypothetical protein n=1 Tax=Streptomyces mutabilis TaxID=67332 RepID=UPI0011466AC9|nr:hypothetical protein [Streptomyces mutabilis]